MLAVPAAVTASSEVEDDGVTVSWGKAANAAAGLFAEADGCHLRPVGGVVERETYDGDWEEVPGAGQPTRAGDVFRAGGGELFFRVSIRRS